MLEKARRGVEHSRPTSASPRLPGRVERSPRRARALDGCFGRGTSRTTSGGRTAPLTLPPQERYREIETGVESSVVGRVV